MPPKGTRFIRLPQRAGKENSSKRPMSSTHKSFLEKTMPLAPRPAEQILNRLVTPQARRRFGKSFNEAELLLPSMKITLIKPDASR